MKKAVRRLAWIVVGIELFWLIAGNLFLNTGLGSWAVSLKPDKFSMQWESGWTLYPGQVNASNLRVQIRTWSTDVELTVDMASTYIPVFPLLGKRLVLDGLQVGTATAVINREVPQGERPAPAKPYPGMTIELRNLSLEKMESLTFNRLKVSGGTASASGSVVMVIRGDKTLKDIQASWESAIISVNDEEFSETVNVNVDGNMTAFSPRKDKGIALLEKVSGTILLEGVVDTLIPLELLFSKIRWIERIDGGGRVKAQLMLDKGRLQPGSVLDIDATALELVALGYIATGSGQVNGHVIEDPNARAAKIDIQFDEFSLARKGIVEPLALGTGLSLSAKIPNLGTLGGLEDIDIVLDIPDSRYPDITVLDDHLPEGLGISISNGNASLKGHIEVVGKSRDATGNIQIQANSLQGMFRSMAFRMDMDLNSKMSGQRLNDLVLGIQGTEFRLFNGVFDNQSVEVEDAWWMTVEVPRGEINLSDPVKMDAEVELSMKDTRALIAMFSEVQDWISRFDGILTINDVAGGAKIRAAERELNIRDLEVHGDKLEMLGELRLSETINDGIFWAKSRIFSAALERIDNTNDWKLINSREWYDDKKQNYWPDQ